MSDREHTRRDALKFFGAGAALSALPAARAALPGKQAAADYFALAQVRLGEGPFLAAQKLDAAYLLRLEPDRMLHNFRLNAGLEPKAPVYGGWESVEPWIEIRCHGHTLGHYLTASACMYESTGDERFAQRVDYIVADLAQCQANTGGWLAAFPDGIAPLTDSLAGKAFAGVPWYTTHKVLAGLRDAHLHRGSDTARDVLLKFSDWIDLACAEVTDERFQKMLDREHGGMSDVLVDVYQISGEDRFRKLAMKFSHRALLDPLRAGHDVLDGLHSNTQIPKVIGFSRLGFGAEAKFFWRTVVNERSFATGGHGDVEHFFPKREFPKHLGSGKTMETCCTHNMMALTRRLYCGDPRVEYFDYFERALFNGILASQDPQTGMNTYFQSTRPGYVRLYHTPFDSFWCCTGSGIENHARYGESVYAHDDDTLYVNLFMASTLHWRERELTVTQLGNFPDGDSIVLRFDCKQRQNLRLRVRHPAWCAGMMTIRNDKGIANSRQPGSYFEIPGGRILPGDTVRIRLPMTLRTELLPQAPDHAALMYGPLVLAGRMGSTGLTPGSQLIINERESGNMLNADVAIPRWTGTFEKLVANTRRTNSERLEFRTTGFEGGASVDLIPWFRATNERYNLYWQRTAPSVA